MAMVLLGTVPSIEWQDSKSTWTEPTVEGFDAV